jgi:hypothetical protein
VREFSNIIENSSGTGIRGRRKQEEITGIIKNGEVGLGS